ncbi:DUF6157 family protein [Planobispora takensis]|uniref:Uncharacterized protein n=1 Tax=Planobispora takensis TaxID=1367882 RepID=A0A8J3WY86_9ACTN|nr:DUF6157 family protein [Planobispora takensis]GII05663.1 hypothetical protein Pta02_76710 [Planobispora takensis]
MDLNYYDTLIAVAEDCPVGSSVEPEPRGGKKTVAVLQFEMLDADPGGLTQEDVLFESWLRRQEPAERSQEELAELRAQLFSKPQACLRASPLPKKYGWGLLFDGEGRVRLCPMESEEYRRILAGEVPEVKVLKAMRSSRAK